MEGPADTTPHENYYKLTRSLFAARQSFSQTASKHRRAKVDEMVEQYAEKRRKAKEEALEEEEEEKRR